MELFNCEKGRKLLADLLPLWPTPVVCATLHSFLEQLPACLAAANAPDALTLADVPALASSLASLPKSLAAEQSASLVRRRGATLFTQEIPTRCPCPATNTLFLRPHPLAPCDVAPCDVAPGPEAKGSRESFAPRGGALVVKWLLILASRVVHEGC